MARCGSPRPLPRATQYIGKRAEGVPTALARSTRTAHRRTLEGEQSAHRRSANPNQRGHRQIIADSAFSRATAAGARPTMRRRRFAQGREPDISGGDSLRMMPVRRRRDPNPMLLPAEPPTRGAARVVDRTAARIEGRRRLRPARPKPLLASGSRRPPRRVTRDSSKTASSAQRSVSAQYLRDPDGTRAVVQQSLAVLVNTPADTAS